MENKERAIYRYCKRYRKVVEYVMSLKRLGHWETIKWQTSLIGASGCFLAIWEKTKANTTRKKDLSSFANSLMLGPEDLLVSFLVFNTLVKYLFWHLNNLTPIQLRSTYNLLYSICLNVFIHSKYNKNSKKFPLFFYHSSILIKYSFLDSYNLSKLF